MRSFAGLSIREVFFFASIYMLFRSLRSWSLSGESYIRENETRLMYKKNGRQPNPGNVFKVHNLVLKSKIRRPPKGILGVHRQGRNELLKVMTIQYVILRSPLIIILRYKTFYTLPIYLT